MEIDKNFLESCSKVLKMIDGRDYYEDEETDI